MARERWTSGRAYEAYVGRWSRLVAARFVPALAVPAGARWLDLGCGTGALTAAIAAQAQPAEVTGLDASPAYVEHARRAVADARVAFVAADAHDLPFEHGSFDAAASGLCLNFLADPPRAVGEMARVVRPGGAIAAYVWDYADGMEPIRRFWDAALEVDPAARELDEARRFPLARPDALHALFAGEAGLERVRTWELVVPARFDDFDDYWSPFEGGQGPAPSYLASLQPALRAELRERLRSRLPIAADGSIELRARAWAVRATAAPSTADG